MEKVPNLIRKSLIVKLEKYKFMQQDLIDIEEKLDKNSFDVNSGIKSKNKISRRVESLAIKLADNEEYQNLKSWKKCIDELFIKYDKKSLKWKFIQRRYILKDTIYYNWNKNRNLKDIDIFKDFAIEGIKISERTFKRLKNSVISDLYKEAKARNLINF